MGDKLDDLLEPGERVVYRTPRNLWSARPGLFLALAATAIGAPAIIPLRAWLASAELTAPTLLFLLLLPVMAFALLWIMTRIIMGDLWITSRRVIGKRGWSTPDIAAAPLDEIVELVRLPGDKLEIRGKDGQAIAVETWEPAEKLARALANATGVAVPILPGRKDKLANAVAISAGTMAFIALNPLIAVGAWSWLESLATPTLPPFIAIMLAAQPPVFATTFVFGGLVGVAAARGFMGTDEIRRWLCRDIELNWRWSHAPMLRFASLLYGQAIRCENCDESGHGR